ncbi:hypothetical protein V5O48_016084 [Marasmius crinis-equi]|uniref:Uncharacterized protein n=1 Tax=Marasmius crinis-equi TaxID=585013 RepID=A0ABR3ESP3_9AGAR
MSSPQENHIGNSNKNTEVIRNPNYVASNRNSVPCVPQLQDDQLNLIVEEVLARIHSTIDALVVDRLPEVGDRLRFLGLSPTSGSRVNDVSSTTRTVSNTTTSAKSAAGVSAPVRTEKANKIDNNRGGTYDQLICDYCGKAVDLPPPEERWYSIARGRRIGWVRGLQRASKLTLGVSGCAFRYHSTEEAARENFVCQQHKKETAVVADGKNVSFCVGPNNGILFP